MAWQARCQRGSGGRVSRVCCSGHSIQSRPAGTATWERVFVECGPPPQETEEETELRMTSRTKFCRRAALCSLRAHKVLQLGAHNFSTCQGFRLGIKASPGGLTDPWAAILACASHACWGVPVLDSGHIQSDRSMKSRRAKLHTKKPCENCLQHAG